MCHAFCVDDNVRQKKEENSDGLIIRCLDVVHYLYHYCSNLSWSSVGKEVRKTDCHLADLIKNLRLRQAQAGNKHLFTKLILQVL